MKEGVGLDYRILGPFEVHRDGVPVPLGGGKQRALLAVLLLNNNRVVSVDRMIEDLWGEEPPDSAANVIQTYVSRLRKALDLPGRPAPIERRPPGYVLHAEREEVDAGRFERIVHQAGSKLQQGDPGSASKLIQ